MYVSVKRKMVLGIVCAAAVVVCGVIGLKLSLGGAVGTMAGENTLTLKKADRGENRIAFLTALGWNVEEEPIEIQEVVVPAELDEVYLKYNELQLSQGFDLSAYCGQRLKRYSYVITNYPGEADEVRANLLVYKGKLVGGDVCSTRLDGFMHGLRQPVSDTLAETPPDASAAEEQPAQSAVDTDASAESALPEKEAQPKE